MNVSKTLKLWLQTGSISKSSTEQEENVSQIKWTTTVNRAEVSGHLRNDIMIRFCFSVTHSKACEQSAAARQTETAKLISFSSKTTSDRAAFPPTVLLKLGDVLHTFFLNA